MKEKMKVGVVVVVAIVAVMMFSSYAFALSQDEIAGLILNASEVDTYKFDMNMTMTMTTEMLMGNETNATEPMVMAMVGNGSGVVDNINKSMWMAMSMCMNMSEIMEANTSEDTNGNVSEDSSLEMPETICMETEMYIINNTMYMKMDMGYILPNFSFWLKSEMTEADWESEEIQGPQMELLNCSNVTLLDDEEVNGVDCYVLKIVPDTEKCWEIVMNTSIMGDSGIMGAEMQNASDILNQSLGNMTITEWIAKDTMFVMKSVAAMDMTMSPDTEEEAKVVMDYTMIFYDYNEPVTIVLPPEAEGATDLDDMPAMLPGGNVTDILPGINETD
jgi:hypothetical protein